MEAAASCEYHFPAESFSLRQDTPGDLAVMRLSELVLDDIPGTDPRQTETMSRGTLTNLSCSLLWFTVVYCGFVLIYCNFYLSVCGMLYDN